MTRPRQGTPPNRPNSADGNRISTAKKEDRRALPRAGRSGSHGSSTLWLWGTHPVLAALGNSERRCHRLLLTSEALRSHGPAITNLAKSRPLPPAESIERADLDGLLPLGAVHQGIALLVDPLPPIDLSDLVATARGRQSAVIVVLDQVTDPHNTGAVLRSAAAFGALGMVMQDRHAPEQTGTLAKAASGALERLPLVRVTNLVRALEELKDGQFWIAGLAGDAPCTLAEANLKGHIALVLGSEGDGLRRLTREHCDHLVKLPQTDLVESLNVSNAAAVALYELVRR
ncbi:MAG TPA: 23S rRNA (guanosine(2251)-2'-O)-methyltransferase RlmB [Rhodospirillaceae bacterium]|nr:23S rRNA (guanosine(2251)-2'-O)-methyltransferase RlmB [Rhodospirillaceae bacterium]